jgi:hypothetical protein
VTPDGKAGTMCAGDAADPARARSFRAPQPPPLCPLRRAQQARAVAFTLPLRAALTAFI